MKYLVVLGDGMGDYPMTKFGGKTALQYARTPHFDWLAMNGELGLVQTVPKGMPPGSDTANLSVLGYDPKHYYTGRSPFEAASMGIELADDDISFRCNLVTLSDDEPYSEKIMVDYCSGEISTEEAAELIKSVKKELGTSEIDFYSGFRYRHLMVWHKAPQDWQLTPPHDISSKKIESFLPVGKASNRLLHMMEESYRVLAKHPVNLKRVQNGLNPANSIWLWGEGRRPLLEPFHEKYGLRGSVISAVDLIKGLGIITGLDPIPVKGATGDIDTNFSGKVSAALEALKEGQDFIYLHIEAPDECSHRFEAENKVKAIELIDQEVVKRVINELEQSAFEYSVMLVTDHATPLSLGTHTGDPVPFVIFRSAEKKNFPGRSFNEACASETGLFIEDGFRLMDLFLGKIS